MTQDEQRIKRIRTAYSENKHYALACWFDEFDDALLSGAASIPACQLLLSEVQQEAYQLTPDEARYVTSRTGTLLLRIGLARHLEDDSLQAQHYYQQSAQLFASIQFSEGEGQVIAAQRELYSTELDRDLLTRLLNEPRVVGNSRLMLSGRVTIPPSYEKAGAILAARRCNYLEPVLLALEDEDPYVRGIAATALSHLKPGPQPDTLVTMIQTADWIQRWQALTIIQERLQAGGEGSATYQDLARFALQILRSNNEANMTVRIAMVELSRLLGDQEQSARSV